MVKLILTIFCVTVVNYQPSSSQYLRPPAYNIINRQIADIIESPRIIQSPTMITDPPVNNILPIPGGSPSTTIITDCSPAVCKNLANTIQLMIVSNLLQNTKVGSDIALQLAGPILNEVISSPIVSCGCTNPIPNIATPNFVSPNIITPNFITPNLIESPKRVSSNWISSPVISTIPSPISTIPASISTIPASISNMNCNGDNALLTNLINLLSNRIQM